VSWQNPFIWVNTLCGCDAFSLELHRVRHKVGLLHSRDERRVDNNTSYDGVPYNEKNPNVIWLHFIVNAPGCSFIVVLLSTKGETFQTRGNINVFLEELQKFRTFWSFDKMLGLQMRSHLELKTRPWKPY
jgi:hypothetical protein